MSGRAAGLSAEAEGGAAFAETSEDVGVWLPTSARARRAVFRPCRCGQIIKTAPMMATAVSVIRRVRLFIIGLFVLVFVAAGAAFSVPVRSGQPRGWSSFHRDESARY